MTTLLISLLITLILGSYVFAAWIFRWTLRRFDLLGEKVERGFKDLDGRLDTLITNEIEHLRKEIASLKRNKPILDIHNLDPGAA